MWCYSICELSAPHYSIPCSTFATASIGIALYDFWRGYARNAIVLPGVFGNSVTKAFLAERIQLQRSVGVARAIGSFFQVLPAKIRVKLNKIRNLNGSPGFVTLVSIFRLSQFRLAGRQESVIIQLEIELRQGIVERTPLQNDEFTRQHDWELLCSCGSSSISWCEVLASAYARSSIVATPGIEIEILGGWRVGRGFGLGLGQGVEDREDWRTAYRRHPGGVRQSSRDHLASADFDASELGPNAWTRSAHLGYWSFTEEARWIHKGKLQDFSATAENSYWSFLWWQCLDDVHFTFPLP
jgi:hypothetical protein